MRKYSNYKMIEIVGFHGTAERNRKDILENGFTPSSGLEHERYLGAGTYFFCKSIANPQPEITAAKWAVVEAHSKKYLFYAVLSANVQIEEDNFLDLTKQEDLIFFNDLRAGYVKKIAQEGLKLVGYRDSAIIQDACNEEALIADAICANMYSNLTKEERISGIKSHIPNCTVLVVRNPLCIKNISTFSKAQQI